MTALYNEIDTFAAQWLRELIAIDAIAPGDVAHESIEDLEPARLIQYPQCHFFAGIGAWSHALRLAGIPDDFPVWTASLPCQPFSQAGVGRGFDDDRHLWPVFHRLVQECRPSLIFGEQVSSPDAMPWLDVVFSDLEDAGYTAAALDLCAAGVGAPHIRQRLYWVAYTDGAQSAIAQCGCCATGERTQRVARPVASRGGRGIGGVADADGDGWGGRRFYLDGIAIGTERAQFTRREATVSIFATRPTCWGFLRPNGNKWLLGKLRVG